MTAAMGAAFDAVSTQLRAASPDAVAPYADWRTRSLDFSARMAALREVLLARVSGRPTIVLAADAGARAAGLFSTYWRRVAAAPAMMVQAADQPVTDASVVSLKYLGGKPGSFDVLAHADWAATFDIGAVGAYGHVPSTPADDFRGMVSRYATGAHVMVPASYLADAAVVLPRVFRLAASTGVSPQNARFTAVTGDAVPAPGGAFLAMKLPLKDARSKVKVEAGRVVMTSSTDRLFLDIAGMNNVAIVEVVEVVKVGGEVGVSYRNAGNQPPAMENPLLLSQGDVALIGSSGFFSEINTADPAGRAVVQGNNRPWLLTIGHGWMLPVLIVIFMIALLVFASRMRRRASGREL